MDNQKSIVVLKNLPSNLLEEAVVVVKTKKSIMDIDYLKKVSFLNFKNKNAEGRSSKGR